MEKNPHLPLKNQHLQLLDRQIKFQREWKNLTLSIYVFITLGSIICTSGATLLAALAIHTPAAIMAAIATIFVTTESTFSFREKWKHHLNILAEFESISLDAELDNITKEDITTKIKTVLRKYATEMPIPTTV